MRSLAAIVLLVVVAGCGRCAETRTDPSGLPEVGNAVSATGAEVPTPGAVYKDAYARARVEVTADNARDRLDELERAIEREAEAMR